MLLPLPFRLGLKNEDDPFDIETFFNEPDLKKTEKYSLTDYISNDKLIELKTRRCYYNSHPSTIVGLNKCKNYDCQKK